MDKILKDLEQVYTFDKKNKVFIIEIALDSYLEAFNEWDSASFRRKDIDPELLDYLEECSADIPLRYPIALHFKLPKKIKNPHKEKMFASALRNFFSFTKKTYAKYLKEQTREALVYAAIALVFLSSAIALEHFFEEFFLLVLSEAFYVGGWVFMWQFFYINFFAKREDKQTLREYERLERAPIKFIYL